MLRPWELFVGQRYIRARRSNGFLSFISVISMLGIAVGVAVLIVVLSVMNGFETELRERILSMASHAAIIGYEGPLEDWRLVRDVALANPEVKGAAPYVEGEGILLAGERHSAVLLRGIDPPREREVSAVVDDGGEGFAALADGTYRIVLGQALAETLAVGVGDKVLLVVSEANVTPAGIVPRMRRFTVAGTFAVGMYEYDRGFAFVHMADAARLYRLRDAVSGVRLRLGDLYLAPRVVKQIAVDLGGGYYVDDWTRKHANFFRSIKLTKTVMFVILLLVVGVAAFNIVSTLVMVVKDKQGDIAILRTVGATPRSIMGVFIVQGSIIGIVGTVAGLALGVALALNIEAAVHGLESLLNTRFLAPDVYFISDLPARLEILDLLRICGTALILSLLSTLYPAWRAAQIQPAEALRYE